MRKFGRIYSVHISGTTLILTLIFALVFAAVSVWSINRYVGVYFQNKELKSQIAELTENLNEYRYQSQVLAQYEELIDELNKPEPAISVENADTVDVSETMVATPLEQLDDGSTEEAPAETEEAGDAPETEKTAQLPAEPPVDAVKLALRPENNNTAMRFQYSLQNVQPGDEAVSGYLFIILTDQDSSPCKLVPYPTVELKEGSPADYKKGLQFSIRRGKVVRGIVEKLTDASDFTHAWVYAFSEKGELLMKKLLQSQNG